jgi:hypothetical protein
VFRCPHCGSSDASRGVLVCARPQRCPSCGFSLVPGIRSTLMDSAVLFVPPLLAWFLSALLWPSMPSGGRIALVVFLGLGACGARIGFDMRRRARAKAKAEEDADILAKLREANALARRGASLEDILGVLDVSADTYHRWKAEYGEAARHSTDPNEPER